MPGITPSQTVGPFYAYGLTPNGKYAWNDAFTSNLLTPDVTGDKIRIEGVIYDGDGKVVPDAVLEIWQADAQGRFADPQDTRGLPNSSFKGFGRSGTTDAGEYSFDTIKPGAVPGHRWQAAGAAYRDGRVRPRHDDAVDDAYLFRGRSRDG
jgi:protocatechuate 3,4-dioxygenase alpha subunit